MSGWFAVLNGVALSGGGDQCPITPSGCLTEPPDGLGAPEIRTEDVTFAQADGTEHFSDWYGPRIITLNNVTVCGPNTGCCSGKSSRSSVREIVQAWSRQCSDIGLVLWPDSPQPSGDRGTDGPFGFIGRPRVASVQWLGQGSDCASLTLRFDCVDQRIYLQKPNGSDGLQCLTMQTNTGGMCRSYPRCYPMCYSGGAVTGTAVTGIVDGDLCVPVSVTLDGPLVQPKITDISTGDYLQYMGSIQAGSSVTVDTKNGTAVNSNGTNVSGQLTGSVFMTLAPGSHIIRLDSYGEGDSGTAELCYRSAVLSA